ncbi:MAG TPA: tyrosine-type recombinase/integrase [Actinomycetes bacterium]|jgi:integrase|nr:tyrosine-type recombinase/integrase [Actinomycetes bacterium]
MAWIVKLPPTPRHPQTRWQVRYRDGTTQRSAGIYPTKAEAVAVKRTVERGDHVAYSDQLSPGHASMLFGEYVTTIWWPAWKPAHPRSAAGTSSKLTARILPRFGNLSLIQLDADVVVAWQRDLTREGLSPRTISAYLSLLGTICNAAVNTGYLDHSPLTVPGERRRRSATLSGTPTEPSLPRMVRLTCPQVHQLADAIDPRYRALVILAAHTGARWSELTTLRWIDVRTNFPLDDGAISGPGRLRLRPPSADDQEESARRGRSRPRPGGRTIALDQHIIDALNVHRDLVDGRARDLVFTSPGGTRGPAGQLSTANFGRVWHRALTSAGLGQAGPDQQRPHFRDLRHTHAVWLLAQKAAIGAIAKRLGHANPVITMRMYQHAATLVAEDQLTTRSLGLTSSS